MQIRFALAAVWVALPAPALAWKNVDDQTSCGLFQSFDDNTTLYFLQTKPTFDAEMIVVSLVNDSWSIKKDQKMTGRLRLETDDGDWVWNDKVNAFVDHGILSAMEEKYFEPFTEINTYGVTVTFDSKKLLIADWNGFWTAYRKFDECRKKKGWLAERQSKKDEADRIARNKRYREAVPVDPFSTPPASPPAKRKRQ